MFKNPKKVFPLFITIFYAIELFLVNLGLNEVGILFYLVALVLLLRIDRKYIISFLVFQLPLLPIIKTDYKLMGLLGPHEIIYGLSFFILSDIYKKNKIYINKYQKISIRFVYFLFFLSFVYYAKDILLGIYPDKSYGFSQILKIFVRLFLYYYSLILLIKIIYLNDYYKYILIGIKTSLGVLVLSMIFTIPLYQMGTSVVVKTEESENYVQELEEYGRFLGFYNIILGDENNAGAFFAGLFGFFLAQYEKFGTLKNYLFVFGFSILGLLLTGSRTAFIILALIFVIFIFTNKYAVKRFSIVFAIIIFFIVFYEQLERLFLRFFDDSALTAIDSKQMGRVGKWILYLDWLVEHPETFIFGNQERIGYRYAPHNIIIYIVYHFGLIPLTFFLIHIKKLIQLITIKGNPYPGLKNIYYVIPPLILGLTTNSIGDTIYLWLYLPLGTLLIYRPSLAVLKNK